MLCRGLSTAKNSLRSCIVINTGAPSAMSAANTRQSARTRQEIVRSAHDIFAVKDFSKAAVANLVYSFYSMGAGGMIQTAQNHVRYNQTKSKNK